jgi:hypothetical protein
LLQKNCVLKITRFGWKKLNTKFKSPKIQRKSHPRNGTPEHFCVAIKRVNLYWTVIAFFGSDNVLFGRGTKSDLYSEKVHGAVGYKMLKLWKFRINNVIFNCKILSKKKKFYIQKFPIINNNSRSTRTRQIHF